MALSVHDNVLVSYEVRCEARVITLRTKYRTANKPTEFTDVIFEGVQGYRFENDAFENIIFGVETVSVEDLLTEFGAEISESYRMAGSPGSWAANLGAAAEYLRERGIKGFTLSSSYGLSGWVLAKEMSIANAEASPFSSLRDSSLASLCGLYHSPLARDIDSHSDQYQSSGTSDDLEKRQRFVRLIGLGNKRENNRRCCG